MTGIAEERSGYRAAFERLERERSAGEPSWILAIRRAAMSRFCERGFPGPRDEDWRYTNVAPIAQTDFELAEPEPSFSSSRLETAGYIGLPGSRLVFVNGYLSPELSLIKELPKGTLLAGFADRIATDPGSLEPHLARYAGYELDSFTALNTAMMGDGAVLMISRGAILEQPIHLVYVTSGRSRPAISYPRTLLVMGEQSQATIVESFLGQAKTVYGTNAVTEISLGEGAVLDYYRFQRESGTAYHIGVTEVQQRRDSVFSSHAVTLGGALTRNEIRVSLGAPGVDCTLNGLFLAAGRQHVDHHTLIDHTRPHGTSRELYKGILGGRATGVFDGKIFVRPDAQKTDARQTNRNLLLSEDAIINTKPQLEINANDVKCAHGSTTGQLSDDAIFYLRSRGLDFPAARALLTYGFASEILGQMRLVPLRASLDELLRSWLPDTARAREAS